MAFTVPARRPPFACGDDFSFLGDTMGVDASVTWEAKPKPPGGGFDLGGWLEGAAAVVTTGIVGKVVGSLGCEILGGGPEDPLADGCAAAVAGG